MNPAALISTTDAIDPVFMFIFGACLVLLLAITAVMLFFVIRYHRSRSPRPTSQVAGNLWLEIVWITLPTLLVLAMFYYGWAGYLSLRQVPAGALEVTATAQMWSWNFSYADGRTSNKLYVPVGQPVKVELVSRDVIHGFYLPAFRVKRDIVPGQKNQVWFVAGKPGSYDLFCSSYCGTNHSAMISTVEALPKAEYTAWQQNSGKGKTSGIDGKKLAEEQGCLGCHSLDGSSGAGPSFKGLYGATRDDGKRKMLAEEAYLKESIRQPGAFVVKGFQPIMPSFDHLSEEEVSALIEFIRSVK